jgi:hypothetical protein
VTTAAGKRRGAGWGRIKHMNSNLYIEVEEYIHTSKNATINDEIYSTFNSILSQ